MPKVVIAEFMDDAAIHDGLIGCDVVYDPALIDDSARLAALVADADALIVRNRTQVRGDLLARARSLKVVGRLGVGLDNIDVEACRERGIAVFPATGANDGAVAEYVIATAMLLLRGAYGASARVAGGTWPRNELMGREIAGKRLGLVGFGAIARETARRAAALGMSLAAYDLSSRDGSGVADVRGRIAAFLPRTARVERRRLPARPVDRRHPVHDRWCGDRQNEA